MTKVNGWHNSEAMQEAERMNDFELPATSRQRTMMLEMKLLPVGAGTGESESIGEAADRINRAYAFRRKIEAMREGLA